MQSLYRPYTILNGLYGVQRMDNHIWSVSWNWNKLLNTFHVAFDWCVCVVHTVYKCIIPYLCIFNKDSLYTSCMRGLIFGLLPICYNVVDQVLKCAVHCLGHEMFQMSIYSILYWFNYSLALFANCNSLSWSIW